jgi:Uma2 family endonuclease
MPLPKDNIKYEEFLKIDEKSDENLEFINGYIYSMAAPTFQHQMILTNLTAYFSQYFKGNTCFFIMSPFDVILKNDKESNKVQPDLSVICDKKGINEKNYIGSPTLVVEVLSPSSRSRDFVTKMDLYMRSGIKEYWIISPEKKQVYLYNFEDKMLKEDPVIFKDKEILKSNIFEEFEINLEDIF